MAVPPTYGQHGKVFTKAEYSKLIHIKLFPI